MYEVKILPSAYRDLAKISGYIEKKLKNPIAANSFLKSVKKAFELLAEFPYAYAVFSTVKETKNEIRSVLVDNYLLLYTVVEDVKTVQVLAVIYAKRDVENILGIED